MNRKRVWRLCTLLPDLPGTRGMASLRVPALRGSGVMLKARLVNKDDSEVNSFQAPGPSGRG